MSYTSSPSHGRRLTRRGARGLPRKTSEQRREFIEKPDCAFFIGKLDKTQDRDAIYTGVRRLGKKYNFYVNKLDMPYGNSESKKGNRGYCFVHCNSKEEAQRVVCMKEVYIGRQLCEVKEYGGRGMATGADSGRASGRTTPSVFGESRRTSGVNTPRVPAPHLESAQLGGDNDNESINLPQQVINILRQEQAVEEHSTTRSHEEEQAQHRLSPVDRNQSDHLHWACERSDDSSSTAAAPMPDERIRVVHPQESAINTEYIRLYTPERVNTYVNSQLMGAASRGDASGFLKNFFTELDGYEKALVSLDANALNLVAQIFAPVLINL